MKLVMQMKITLLKGLDNIQILYFAAKIIKFSPYLSVFRPNAGKCGPE